MKKVLGLDLGTTSIGWALVNQAENSQERSSIIKTGVRVNPLSSDEKDSFEQGKAISTNSARTLKRSMRRNLQRYKLRRGALISIMKREGWINDSTILSENGQGTTHETLRLRALAVSQEVTMEQFARILLEINKKRGYKSNRKAKANEEDGHLINGMSIAKALYERGLTPGQYSLALFKDGYKVLPDYYRSDLEREYESIWECQAVYYPDILTEEFHKQLQPQGKSGVSKIFLAKYDIYCAENKGSAKKVNALIWRTDALKTQLEKSVLAYVLADLREEIRNSSGYLGDISDRSKELFFNNLTVGQYLLQNIEKDPAFSTKNKSFYRQDYLDEFEKLWETQSKFHDELTDELKKELRDVVIFYQRPLKSQKGLISFCEFESKQVQVEVNGIIKTKTRGCRVAPRSSLLFQEFKIWQILNNIIITDTVQGTSFCLSTEQMTDIAKELTAKRKISGTELLRLLGYKGRRYEINYKTIEGNSTMAAIYEKCLEIVELSGHGEYSASKLSFDDIEKIISDVFHGLGFKTDFLYFNSGLAKEEYEKQASFHLWHLLYSYEGDKSLTGDASLIEKISSICGMPSEYASVIAGISFNDDYASLSNKAMRKILPFLKEGNRYDVACAYAGYNHSHFETSEELEKRQMKDHLEILPKGSLRNPVVEKIINQMINVVNGVSEHYGKPDEIHIEFARELKQSQEERRKTMEDISTNTKKNEGIVKILKEDFGLSSISQKDIVRYKLYEELKDNGYKTLYSNKYISPSTLFSKDIDIEHIIPQARMFNDSFANKTLEYRDVNIKKGKETARDYIESQYGNEALERYGALINDLYQRGAISKTKKMNLLMKGADIPTDFLNRDLSMSQYIAKKSRDILCEYVKVVMPTTGSITKRLREDWQLVDVLKELNLPKYRAAGLTYTEDKNDGGKVEKIEEWTKRNDHRHHAMDAITIAFTTQAHIQILNNLNANSEKEPTICALKHKYMQHGGAFYPPIPVNDLRNEVKEALESTLVSIKAKNKVVTTNNNKTKAKDGIHIQKTLTPRGALHKEQVYGKRAQYEVFYVPVGSKMTPDVIETVASKIERDALRARLALFSGNPKKAFSGDNSPDKSPIYLDYDKTVKLQSKVRCVRFKYVYSIRKEIGPGFKIDKVADARIRDILQTRLDAFGGNSAKAFSDLENNPIWLKEEKKIKIKRVTIFENFDLVALHDKRDKDGKLVLDKNGNTIPTDFVNLRSNHHIAIFRDENGKLQEHVVSFFEALQRISAGLSAVDKDYRRSEGWSFLFSMKVNEMFVFPNASSGFFPEKVDLLDTDNYKEISRNLYRVQKLSKMDYCFRHHLETTISDTPELKDITWKRIKSLQHLEGALKVRINHIGQIVSVGEYD